MVEAQEEQNEEEHVLDNELEAKYQEAAAMMTVAKQWRTEVDQARQFFRKPQSQGKARQAQTETSVCAVRATWPLERRQWVPDQSEGCQLGGNRGASDRRTSSISDHFLFVTRERTMCNHKRCNRYCVRTHLGWNSLA